MDLVALARTCLSAAARPRGPHPVWVQAIGLVRSGDGAGAGEALCPLSDRARIVATQLLERLAVREGLADEVVRAIGAPLARDLKPNALSFDATGWLWSRGYREELEGLHDVARLKGTRPHGYGAAARLRRAVGVACAAGDLPQAERLVGEISDHHKEDLALARCALAEATPPGAAADAHWQAAVKAAKRPPMIQDGAEEAEALAAVLARMVLCLPPDHAAVAGAVGALLNLGRTRAPKDARSTGICRAAEAAARRAVDDFEASAQWIAHAEALLQCSIDHPSSTALLALALAHRARGDVKGEHAALKRVLPSAWTSAPEVRRLYPDRAEVLASHWNHQPGGFNDVRLVRAAGGDASALLEGAVRSACIYAGGAERAFGALIALAHAENPRAPWTDDPQGPIEARAHALLVGRVKDRPAALAAAAQALVWTEPEAGKAWFRAALDAGFVGRWPRRSARSWAQTTHFGHFPARHDTFIRQLKAGVDLAGQWV